MKIPTLFGLTLLSIAMILGVFIYFLQKKSQDELAILYEPKKIQVVNIQHSSASVTWQTDNPSLGQVIIYDPPNTNRLVVDDYRHPSQLRLTHFVTLKNLTPGKKYQVLVKNDDFIYSKKPVEFKTLDKNIQPESQKTISIIGTVVDKALNPVDEALVFLKTSDMPNLGAFTSIAGSFIIPVKELAAKTDATLVINRGDQQSIAKISFASDKDIQLPPLKLGENIDLREFLATATGSIKQKLVTGKNKFDLNADGVVNSLDVSIIFDNFGKNPKNEQSSVTFRQADLNSDRIVDFKDVDLIKKEFE